MYNEPSPGFIMSVIESFSLFSKDVFIVAAVFGISYELRFSKGHLIAKFIAKTATAFIKVGRVIFQTY